MKSSEVKIWDNEYDTEFIGRLCEFLKTDCAAVCDGDHWGVWGAQEVTQWCFRMGSHSLTVMAETYMGITLTGPQDVLKEIVSKAKEKGLI